MIVTQCGGQRAFKFSVIEEILTKSMKQVWSRCELMIVWGRGCGGQCAFKFSVIEEILTKSMKQVLRCAPASRKGV